jgi:hypothetical protein
MAKLKPIKREMVVHGRNPNHYKRLKVLALEIIPAPGVNLAAFKGIIQGETANYVSTIQFTGLEFGEEEKDSIEAKLGDKTLFFQKPLISRNDVKLKCSCPDFRFRFEKPLFDNKGLIGNWRKYTRVTPPKTRPSNAKNPNPDGHDFVEPYITGYCKHISSLLWSLKTQDLIS